MLRDRLVCGINNEKIQNRLLSETELTYQKALSLAQSSEAAAQKVKELQQRHPFTSEAESKPSDFQSGICKVGEGSNRNFEKKVYVIVVAEKAIWHRNVNSETLPAISVGKEGTSRQCAEAKQRNPQEARNNPQVLGKYAKLGMNTRRWN